MLATFPDSVVGADLSQIDGFEEPVELMAGTASEAANQVEDIFVVYTFGFELIGKLFFWYAATEESAKGSFESFDAFLAETGASQSEFVYAADFAGVSPCHNREGRDISGDG